jgi:hypothetical protein
MTVTRYFGQTANAASAHQFHVALGDLPTWALFVGALVAALIALRQLRIQQEDSGSQTRQLERQQANDIDFTWYSAAKILIRTSPPSTITTAGRTVVVVENNSRRPIRDVTCWIQLQQSPGKAMPIMLGLVGEPANASFELSLNNPYSATQYALIRPTAKCGYLFECEIPLDNDIDIGPRAFRPMVQFIDDADLKWQVDDDLRLQKIEPPSRPWPGLLGR